MEFFFSMINHQILWNWCQNLVFFHKTNVLIKIIKLILLITNLHSKGLERNIRDVGAKCMTLFDVFNRVLAFQMKVCLSRMFK
jgi:hypothetical protein